MDPLDHEVIWQKLYNGSYWAYGGGPIPFAAISAIDIALWDIKGKATNLPVYKLLGGKLNPKIKAYASQIQLGWGPIDHPVLTPEDYAREAKRAIAEGFTAVKVDPFGPMTRAFAPAPSASTAPTALTGSGRSWTPSTSSRPSPTAWAPSGTPWATTSASSSSSTA